MRAIATAHAAAFSDMHCILSLADPGAEQSMSQRLAAIGL
jgi:hypothetical protein